MLTNHRICLRLLDKSDWPLFREIYTSPEVMANVYGPLSLDDARDAFQARLGPWDRARGGWLSFTIESLESETDPKLGFIGLKIVNQRARVAEFGLMLRKSAQRQGYAVDAMKVLTAHAFDNLDINKVSGICSTRNPGSVRLLEKLGFAREGRLAENSIVNGVFVDDYIYGLCKASLQSD